jgi:hypothetical protein
MAVPSGPEFTEGQGARPWENEQDRHVPAGGNPHGKPTSWALVAVIIAAFSGGGAALILHTWWLFWTCAGVVLLTIPVGKMIGIMNDTISWGATPAATRRN